jgi:hypothetical protein
MLIFIKGMEEKLLRPPEGVSEIALLPHPL